MPNRSKSSRSCQLAVGQMEMTDGATGSWPETRSFQAKALAAGDGEQVIVDLEARLEGEIVDGGDVGEEGKLAFGVGGQEFADPAKLFSANNQGGFAQRLDDFSRGGRVPRLQSRDNRLNRLNRFCF